jgi:hypothetical protein
LGKFWRAHIASPLCSGRIWKVGDKKNILEGLEMENIGIFYDYLDFSTAIFYIFCPLGIFIPFWYIVPRKNLATLILPS